MATLIYVVVDPGAERAALGQRRAPAPAAAVRRAGSRGSSRAAARSRSACCHSPTSRRSRPTSTRARRWCCTPTAWSSGRASTSTAASTGSPRSCARRPTIPRRSAITWCSTRLVPEAGAPDDVALLTLRTIPMADRFRVELPTEPEALASMRALLRRWLRHAGGRGGRDRRGPDRVRGGGHQRDRARRRRHAVRDQRQGRRSQVEISVRDFGRGDRRGRATTAGVYR